MGSIKKKTTTYYSAVSVFKESTKSSESISGNRVVRREMVQNELYRVVGRDENVSWRMLICLFTSSTLWALRCLSLLPPRCLSVCLASLAQGLHEQRYYEAVLNNRSFSPPSRQKDRAMGKGGAHAQIRPRKRRENEGQCWRDAICSTSPSAPHIYLWWSQVFTWKWQAARLIAGESRFCIMRKWRHFSLALLTVGRERVEGGATAKQQQATYN